MNQTQLAEEEGVSQFLVAQHVKLPTLPPEIINFILALDCPQDLLFFSERRLRPVLSAPVGDQLAVFDQICTTWGSKKARDHSKKPA